MSSVQFQLKIPIEQMSKSQQKIADFIVKHAERIPFYTEENIALGAGVSISTVSRFWQAIGYDNLKAFKKQLQDAQLSLTPPAVKIQQVLDQADSNITNLAFQMFDAAAAHLSETKGRLLADQYNLAVSTLTSARHIYVHAPGSAACLGQLLQFRLNRIGIFVQLLADSGHSLHEKLVHAGKEDVVLCFGFVRTSPELSVILEQSQQAGYRTILITDLLVAEMIDQSDIVLHVDRGEREAFHSLVAPMVLVDSLSISITGEHGEEAMHKLQQLHQLRKQYSSTLPK